MPTDIQFLSIETGMIIYLNVQSMIPIETVIDLKWLILLKWEFIGGRIYHILVGSP